MRSPLIKRLLRPKGAQLPTKFRRRKKQSVLVLRPPQTAEVTGHTERAVSAQLRWERREVGGCGRAGGVFRLRAGRVWRPKALSLPEHFSKGSPETSDTQPLTASPGQ